MARNTLVVQAWLFRHPRERELCLASGGPQLTHLTAPNSTAYSPFWDPRRFFERARRSSLRTGSGSWPGEISVNA
jgi:hypothetical protein